MSDGRDLRPVERALALVHGFLKVSLARGDDAERDASFGEAHRRRSVPSKSVLARMTSSASVSAILSSASIR